MKKEVTIFLSGDVMTGRGVDQIMPHPSNPVLYESYVKDARDYVKLAEKVNGRIDPPVAYAYLWGDALKPMKDADVRIINLETSITYSENYADKGINYRMHPENIPCLTVAHIDCCVLANNHVLDWGQEGLIETIETLDKVGIHHSGAGRSIDEAVAPSVLSIEDRGRILVFSLSFTTSGIPRNWKASKNKAGVNLLDDYSMETVKQLSRQIATYKQPKDIVVVSIHWGGNWGYEIPQAHQDFAHNLIDRAGVDLVHGHSSHHFLGIEIYQQKPIIYGCGDLLNDYEGISGHKSYKAFLGFLYLVTVDATDGNPVSMKMVPSKVKKLQIVRPGKKECNWMHHTLDRECRQFGTHIQWEEDGKFSLVWN